MKPIKTLLLIQTAILLSITGFAQKQRFDVVSFTAPKGWQQKQFEGGMQLSHTDKKTGAYAIALITKASSTEETPNDNFITDWNRLVKAAVQVNEEPTLLDPSSENGWEIISGMANYVDGETKGLATLLTATGAGQMVSVILMSNTDNYSNELTNFISSITLKKVSSTNMVTNPPNSNTKGSNQSIAGMWVHYNTESSGTYNGFPQLTGGYMRREYVFNNDGSYVFRSKHWMVYVKDILFVYETGTYAVNGNKLTLTPEKGKGEFWSKIPNDTKAWGKLVKSSSDYKQEKTTYTIEFRRIEGLPEINLSLKTSIPTERDGSSGNTNVHEFIYKSRDSKQSLIDNPPGFKPWSTNKTNGTVTSATSNTATTSSAGAESANNTISGLWVDYNAETSANPYNTNYAGGRNLTGGYRNKEYHFYPDGTYLYRKKYWVTTMKEILYSYETGTYSLKGDKLTIRPKKGKAEWWSKAGSQTNAWGKFIKADAYQIENTTYTITLIIDPNYSNSLKLKSGKPTERDGGQFNAPNDPFEFTYSFRKMESLIDNPPGYPKQINTK